MKWERQTFCILKLQLTNSMEHNSSWEANSHSANEEIPCFLLDLMIQYKFTRAHNSVALSSTL
jgi:hypothetical protein